MIRFCMVFLFLPFSAVYAHTTHVTLSIFLSPFLSALHLVYYYLPSPLCPKECSKCGGTSCSCGPENCQCPKGTCACGKTGEWLLTTLSYLYAMKCLIHGFSYFLPSLHAAGGECGDDCTCTKGECACANCQCVTCN